MIVVAQNMLALERANEIRLQRAALKRAVYNGHLTIGDVLLSEDELDQAVIAKMRVGELLTWQRRFGHDRARKVLARLKIGEFVAVSGLSRARRRQLLEILG